MPVAKMTAMCAVKHLLGPDVEPKVNTCALAGGASRVRDDNQYRIIAAGDFVERWGSDRSIKRRTDLEIAQWRVVR